MNFVDSRNLYKSDRSEFRLPDRSVYDRIGSFLECRIGSFIKAPDRSIT